MAKEAKSQAKVSVGLEALWKAMAKDLCFITPKIMPNFVRAAEVIEGDGGLGTVLLFHFGPDVPTMTYQKEKITEFDESLHRIALQVIEGGHLNHGFSYYKTSFQLTAAGGQETLIDVTVEHEPELEGSTMTSRTMESTLFFIGCLEKYLLNGSS